MLLAIPAMVAAFVIFYRYVDKVEQLEIMRGDRDGWINFAAECRRDGGEALRKRPRLNAGVLKTLDRADEAHSKGRMYKDDRK